MVPVALAALLLGACGSDSSGSESSASDTVSNQSTGDLNDADVLFAQGMIPHHRQAVEMADLVLDPEAGASPEIVALATEIKGITEVMADMVAEVKDLKRSPPSAANTNSGADLMRGLQEAKVCLG